MVIYMYKYFFIFLFSISFLNEIEFKRADEYIATLDTKKGQRIFGNVIQGLAYHDGIWITSQTQSDKAVVLNFFKNYKSIFNFKIPYPTHAQDLSVSYDKDKKLLSLYTVSKDWSGVVRFTLDLSQENPILREINEFDLSCKHCTSTISSDSKYFTSKNSKEINVFSSKDVFENKMPKALSSFNLDKEQTKKGISFQGIAMQDEIIYTLSGNDSLDSDKWLIVYDIKGKVLYKDKVIAGKEEALKEGNKYEPEALEIVGNELYATFMSGQTGKNIKRLYKILEVKK